MKMLCSPTANHKPFQCFAEIKGHLESFNDLMILMEGVISTGKQMRLCKQRKLFTSDLKIQKNSFVIFLFNFV